MDESDSQSEQSENFGYPEEQLPPCHMWPCDSPKNATYVNLLPPVAWWHDADNTLGITNFILRRPGAVSPLGILESTKMKWLVLLSVLLSGCATPRVAIAPASMDEQRTAMAQYMNCLVPYAKRYDDGVSDASTISRAMVGACSDEYDRWFETITRADNEAVKRSLLMRKAEMQASASLNVVLDVRAAARK